MQILPFKTPEKQIVPFGVKDHGLFVNQA
jgi:hypothetical protein